MIWTELKKRVKSKLTRQDGDSIAEVLIALLISSLALVMLASMITSSAKMITGSSKVINDYYTAMNSINTYTVPAIPETIPAAQRGEDASVTVSLSTGKTGSSLKSFSQSYNVSFYADLVFQNKPVIVFKLK